MHELLKMYLIVCPLIFLGGFVDSVAGGGGLKIGRASCRERVFLRV